MDGSTLNRYENTRASKLIRRVLKDIKLCPTEINVSALSRDLGVSHTNIWFYLRGLRKWNVEVWLDTLAAFRKLKINGDTIQLDIPLTPEMKERFEFLSRNRNNYIREPET